MASQEFEMSSIVGGLASEPLQQEIVFSLPKIVIKKTISRFFEHTFLMLKKNYIVYYNCFVCNHTGNEGFGLSGTSGHVHRPDVKTSANVNGPLIWTTTGCMCRTNAEYTTTMEKWHNSFLIVHVDTLKRQVVPEHILFTDFMTCVGGKYYFR